ncbi:hypothetical protein HG535_0E00990 [Zygotorulaspora mrakii]|uniref:Transcription factor IIIB 70 kDa subunit n=1 Tax=Zygotorulaspora mrakii TaxID=42260 RepID=A0A7H9B2X4_ZYGMR|nr:uncharacterized protein HG535_0E00990 [Zygotorulaspora mrakii]QLG73015.1 hypothetical protein HG535_0E00990 [Zygotorulaspora mrakii]
MAVAVCKNCKGTSFIRDTSNANQDLVCESCGYVCEDNPIVSEVTFGETSSGAATVQGSFIAAGQAHSGSTALESREATLNNARRKLRAVSHALHIPEYITDAAFQWYKLALAHNFVQGRRSQNVIASCLYIACRKEKTTHMLIDFSSRLQVSVYSIGATFLKMVKRLHITNLPLADPSLFIQHFAEKLDLGDKKVKVARDAVKLAQRMSHDWMYEGRRPAGIAGACILLACRMNNLRRTHSEIVAVSHVAEETIQHRLNEFKNTNAAKLSINEFRSVESSGESAAPPSFVKNRINERKLKSKLESAEKNETSEEALKKNPILNQLLGDQELSSKEVLFYLKKFSERREHSLKTIKSTHGIDDHHVHRTESSNKRSLEGDSEHGENTRGDTQTETPPTKVLKLVNGVAEWSNNNDVKDKIDGYSLETDPYRPRMLHLLPTTSSLLAKVSDDPENLEDADDGELDTFLLDEEASKLKERIWIGINGDFLLEQETKRLKSEADIAAGNTSGKKKRGTRRRKDKSQMDALDAANVMNQLGDESGLKAALKSAEESGDFSTADSVKNMLQKASFSKKINYEAIDGLFNQ